MEIERQKKISKQLRTEQVRRENRLNNIIEKSEPDMVKNINDRTTRLAYLNEKLGELQQEKIRLEELKGSQSNTLDELKTKMNKLQQIASTYGISLETHDESQKQYKQLIE